MRGPVQPHKANQSIQNTQKEKYVEPRKDMFSTKSVCKSVVTNLVSIGRNSTLTVLGLRLVAFGIQFSTTILVARAVSIELFGLFSFAMAVLGLSRILVMLGSDKFLMRQIPRLSALGDRSKARRTFSITFTVALFLSCFLVTAAYIVEYTAGPLNTKWSATLLIVTLLPLYAALGQFKSLLKGIEKQNLVFIPEEIALNLIFLILVLVYHNLPGNEGNINELIQLFAVALLIALAIAYLLNARELGQLFSFKIDRSELRQILRSLLALAAVAGLWDVTGFVDRIFLGMFSDSDSVAIYAIAKKFFAVSALLVVTVNMIFGPKMSRAFQVADLNLLADYAHTSVVVTLSVVLTFTVSVFLLGDRLFGLVGDAYVDGSSLLILLLIFQIAGLLFGNVGLVLVMTDNADATFLPLLSGLIASLLLFLIIIPAYGATGAAVAFMSGECIARVLMWIRVRRRLGIDIGVWSSGKIFRNLAGPAK